MADKLPFDEPIRRVMDANLRYYEALGQITQEYWRAVFGVFRDIPVRFGGRPQATPAAASAAPNPSAPAAVATLVLEAASGSEAQGVFLVENRLERTVSTTAVVSAFADPSGRTIQPALRVQPGVVTLQPGGRTLVQIVATIDDGFEPDVAYRGEVTVPGLSDHGIPVLLRRLADKPAKGEPTGAEAAASEPASKQPASKQPPAKKSAAKKSTAKKSAAKKSARKRGRRTSGS